MKMNYSISNNERPGISNDHIIQFEIANNTCLYLS